MRLSRLDEAELIATRAIDARFSDVNYRIVAHQNEQQLLPRK
jgi:hypothetical protein